MFGSEQSTPVRQSENDDLLLTRTLLQGATVEHVCRASDHHRSLGLPVGFPDHLLLLDVFSALEPRRAETWALCVICVDVRQQIHQTDWTLRPISVRFPPVASVDCLWLFTRADQGQSHAIPECGEL